MRAVSALFSILMPGFGQIYNGQIKKGIFLLVVEHFDNMLGKINRSIQLDFNGFHQEALATVIYDAMLFYLGFYVYTVWCIFSTSLLTSLTPFLALSYSLLISFISVNRCITFSLFPIFSADVPIGKTLKENKTIETKSSSLILFNTLTLSFSLFLFRPQ